MSATGEPPADEDPGVNANDNNADAADATKDVSDAETEPAMLEEEEMPTYMSLTCSSKPDESRAELRVPEQAEEARDGEERASSPYASEQGADSVCVLSSGEESDRRAYGLMGDYDSDEMDMEEEEDEEEDDEDDSCPPDEDESDGDIEPEQFERSSDDFVLRYDVGIEKNLDKERSRSLQDLTNSRGNLSRFVGKRRSIDMMGSYETEFSQRNFPALIDPLMERKKIPRTVKYDHVPSKVKMYIQDMKEQRRLSMERKRNQNSERKNLTETKDNNPDVGLTGSNSVSRTLKSYVQNAIDELAIEEQSNVAGGADYSAERAVDNKTEITALSLIAESNETKEIPKSLLPETPMKNIGVKPENPGKIKPNGLVDYSTRNNVEKTVEPMEICTVNGQMPMAAILDFRSLSYDEYTNGIRTSSAKSNIEFVSRPQISDNGHDGLKDEIAVDMQDPLGDVTPKNDKKSLSHDPRECDDNRETMNRKLDELSTSLKQKNEQIDNMREAYQKTLAENMGLKRELEEMKIFVEKCRVEHRRPETRVASMQTDVTTINEESVKKIEEAKAPPGKILSSSITSALSSIEQWTDSNCSPAISMDPPNIENALNSDDSFVPLDQRTPRKTLRPLSQSFITSSRILQTLANITQGRTKVSANLVDSNDSRLDGEQTGQSKRDTNKIDILSRNDDNCARSRKRKASDVQGSSGSSQPFKMPYKPDSDARRNVNSDSNADGAFKTTLDEQQQQRNRNRNDIDKRDDNTNPKDDFNEDNGATDVPDNVKCFVYRDEPDSKERSFLIQAEDSMKIDENGERAGNFRECGPYLLGNVEIRMSEANGTINIWGKEVDVSNEDGEVDVETEDSRAYEEFSFAAKSSLNCPITPRPKFQNGSTFVCSTNKKSRLSPQFGKTGLGKYFRQATSHLTRNNAPANNMDFESYAESQTIDNRTGDCEHCELQRKRVKLSSCEHLANTRVKQHSCCLHDFEINDRDYDCSHVREFHDDTTIYDTMTNILASQKKCAAALHNATIKNRRNSETHDDERQQTKKRCPNCAIDVPSCNTRLTPGNLNCSGIRSRSHSHNSCEDEDHPLISNNHHGDTPEIKRRRSSGKRVRGILTDLLRGCGGCRDPGSTSTLPKIRVTPCTPTGQASCSKRRDSCPSHYNHASNDDGNEKCIHSCSRRSDIRAQIENQLEIIRVDMERLRSRSDAILEMLNLVNAETD